MESLFGDFTLVWWHWWVLALALVALETMLTATTYLLGIALAAVITGIVSAVMPEARLGAVLTVFAALSVIGTVAVLWITRHIPAKTDEPLLNRRLQQYIGRRAKLIDDTDGGTGRVRLGDTNWSVRLEDGATELRAGSAVEVVAAEGAFLIVRPAAG